MIQDINTYKVHHPTIKEITIGDKFVTRRGDIIEFIAFFDDDEFCFIFRYSVHDKESDYETYTSKLKYYDDNDIFEEDIKERYIPLKDKLNQL
jgi:signal peptidase I